MCGPKDNLGATKMLQEKMALYSKLSAEAKNKIEQKTNVPVVIEREVPLAAVEPQDIAMLPAIIQRELILLEQKKINASKEMVDTLSTLLHEVQAKAQDASLHSLATTLGVIADKIQLLSGGATIRIESKEEKRVLELSEREKLYDHILRGKNVK